MAKVLMMRNEEFINTSTIVCALGLAVRPTPRALHSQEKVGLLLLFLVLWGNFSSGGASLWSSYVTFIISRTA